MPELEAGFLAAWGATAPCTAATVVPWGDAAAVENVSTGYVAPPAPPGGSTFVPNDLTATTALGPATSYHQAHTLVVTDLRTGNTLQVDSVRIGLDDGAAFWTLAAEGPGSLYAALTGGEQPALVEVAVDGHLWAFVVETVARPRSSGPTRVSFGGRSVAALADSPYQFALTYSAEAPTTAAQLCAGALLAAGVELEWKLSDWLIPAGAVSIQGTPMDVVRAVAGAVGAVVTAHPSEYRITVQSRYELLPNEWAYAVPDAQLHSSAVESETFERADKPAYTGIFVAGQQGGALAYVRLEGTSGGDQAPMVTDPLLTDSAALTERARSVLGAGGQQARVGRVVPVCTGAGQPGLFARGQLVRCVDAAVNGGADGAGNPGIWHGLLRSVALAVQLPVVRQTLGFERHTGHIVDPQVASALLSSTIPDIDLTVGAAVSVDLTAYHSGGAAPVTWSTREGVLPPGVSFSGAGLGGIAGYCGEYPVRFRLTDAVSQMVDFNEVTITVGTDGPAWVGGSASGAAAFSFTALRYGDGAVIAINTHSTTSSSVFNRSVDGGATWSTVTTGLTARQCSRLLFGASKFVVLTGNASADRAVYRSTDGGATWTYHATALPSSGFWYATAYDDASGLFMAARWGTSTLAVSADGITWTTRTLPASKNWWNLVPCGDRLLMNSRTDRIVYASDDGGLTWAVLSTIPGSGTAGPLLYEGGLVFAGQLSTPSTELWVSADFGATWTAVTLPLTTASYGVIFVESQGYWFMYRYASGGYDQVMVSIDGFAWTVAPNEMPITGTGFGTAYGGGTAIVASFNGAGAGFSRFPNSIFP